MARRVVKDTLEKNIQRANVVFAQQSLAQERVGETSKERLKWLLEFSKKNLDLLHPEERVALSYDLRALLKGSQQADGLTGEPYLILRSVAGKAMDESVFRELHREIKDGFKQLFSNKKSDEDHLRQWAFPLPKTFHLWRQSGLISKRTRFQFLSQFDYDDEKGPILNSILNILIDSQNVLRACVFCYTPFVPVRRQEYCSQSCSQKARDKRRASRGK